jgi:hypothetical protein
MKRGIGVLLGLFAAAFALAQAPFTIVRPAEGSKVREKVKIDIPGDSIPDGGYVGIFVGGKFVEATVLDKGEKFYEYILDTKARNIPDGDLRIEVVLYVDFNDAPRIVDRSSVDVVVQNSANIPIPEDGIALRYKFVPGSQMIYNMEQRVAVSTITQAQNQLGGRAAELPLESESVRLLYAVDNRYPNGDGLLRMQALPNKGKDYATLTTLDQTEPRRYYDYEMAPIYMRLDPTGKEVFGSIPLYVPMQGTAGEPSRTDLFADFPLPSFPQKNVKPGDRWQGRFQWGKLDRDQVYEQPTVVENFPAVGQFLGVEWEMGFPCAKIQHAIQAGTKSIEGIKLAEAGRDFTDEKVAMTETIWFALDTGKIVKIIRDITIDRKVEQAADGGAAAGGGAMGAPAGGGRRGPMGAAGTGGPDLPGNGKGGGPIGEGFFQRGGPQGGGRRGGPMGTAGGGPEGAPGGGDTGLQRGGQTGRGAGGSGTPQFVRVKVQQIFTLEK